MQRARLLCRLMVVFMQTRGSRLLFWSRQRLTGTLPCLVFHGGCAGASQVSDAVDTLKDTKAFINMRLAGSVSVSGQASSFVMCSVSDRCRS